MNKHLLRLSFGILALGLLAPSSRARADVTWSVVRNDGVKGTGGKPVVTSADVSLSEGTYTASVHERVDPKNGATVVVEVFQVTGNVFVSLARPMSDLILAVTPVKGAADLCAAPLTVVEMVARQPASEASGQRVEEIGPFTVAKAAPGRLAQDTACDGAVRLQLPPELRKIVEQAVAHTAQVIVVFNVAADGKKGLNAVNVKLA